MTLLMDYGLTPRLNLQRFVFLSCLIFPNSITINKKAFPYKQKGKQSHERIEAVGGGFEPPRRS